MAAGPLNRRKALFGAAGAFAAVAGGGVAFATLAKRQGMALRTRAGVAFGTTVALTLAGETTAALNDAFDVGFTAIRAVENASSVYRADSDLSRLNSDGYIDAPDAHLMTQMRYAAGLSAETNGVFDVTVQPLWDLWARLSAQGQRPTPEDLRPVLARVDWRGIKIESDRISFDRPGMAVTLNALNQAYAADVVMDAIKTQGIQHALIDTGEFGALGHHPQDRAWRLGIVDPRATDSIAFTIDPFRRFAATSGDYKTYFSPDFKDHHIFDPRTGYSPPAWSSITVEAPTGLVANGLTTALFGLEIEDARRLLARHPDCTGRFFAKDGRDLGSLAGSA